MRLPNAWRIRHWSGWTSVYANGGGEGVLGPVQGKPWEASWLADAPHVGPCFVWSARCGQLAALGQPSHNDSFCRVLKPSAARHWTCVAGVSLCVEVLTFFDVHTKLEVHVDRSTCIGRGPCAPFGHSLVVAPTTRCTASGDCAVPQAYIQMVVRRIVATSQRWKCSSSGRAAMKFTQRVLARLRPCSCLHQRHNIVVCCWSPPAGSAPPLLDPRSIPRLGPRESMHALATSVGKV